MAKYTTELRSICEQYAGYDSEQGGTSVNTVIQKALPKLFDFTFPIYDENYRSVLETKIVKHFYTREIGYETVGRWKLALDERLNLIMPYYNERYKSTLFEFNPMYDVDLTTDHSKGNEGNSENTNTGTSDANNDRNYNRTDTNSDSDDGWQYYNDTPQGGITGLETGKYLTNATHNTNTSNSTNNETATDTTASHQNSSSTGKNKYTDTESYLEHVKGKSSGTSYSKLLTEYRKTFINIDNEIINELNDLFFGLW